mmetsp:Transcript_146785/g.267564  ORF Transcript_146785/g.267564 Transcript_146785/m.267564 type:complete len:234 (+) Transcript_146785:365-1066(+)
MSVCLDVPRGIIGHHCMDGWNIQASGSQICGDEHINLACPVRVKDAHALALLQLSVQGLRLALEKLREILADLLGCLDRLHKDEELTFCKNSFNPLRKPRPLSLIILQNLNHLRNCRRCSSQLSNHYSHRVAQEVARKTLNLRREGRRKKQRLSARPDILHNGPHLVFKAHVQHPVGFVQHQKRATPQIHATLHLDNVNHSPWVGNDYFTALFYIFELLLLREPSHQCRAPQA